MCTLLDRWVDYDIYKSTDPQVFSDLINGEATVFVPYARNSRYKNSKIKDKEIQMYALPSLGDEESSISATVTKGMTSTFLTEAKTPPLVFFHPQIQGREYTYEYKVDTCKPQTKQGSQGVPLMSVSPFGLWRVKVESAAVKDKKAIVKRLIENVTVTHCLMTR